MKHILIIVLLFISKYSYSIDTLQVKRDIRDSLRINEKFIGVRVATGIHKTFFYELGLSYNKIYGSEYGSFGSLDIYSSFEITPLTKKYDAVYGIKAGIIGGTQASVGGIELNYLYNNSTYDFLITPKVGIGLFTYIEILYGYNMFTNNKPFANIGRHQFSLILNLAPKELLKKKKKIIKPS